MTEAWSVSTGDGLEWLQAREGTGAVVTSPPDASELGMDDPAEYRRWLLREVLALVFEASTGPTVLVMTDRKRGGRWESKPWLAQEAAALAGLGWPLWHRIALRKPLGSTDLHVPTYSHVLAYGPGRPGKPRPDVFAEGRRWWAHGVGWDLAAYVAGWLAEVAPGTTVLDPFAGAGTFLVAARRLDMPAHGCEIDPRRAATARLYLSETGYGRDPASFGPKQAILAPEAPK